MASVLKEQANTMFKNGHTKQALEKYSEALKISDNDEKLYANRALCFMKLRDYPNSLKDAMKALLINPSWYKSWFRVAEAYKGLLDWKPAIVAYYKASISRDIRDNNKLRKFCQKQLLLCQISHLTHVDDTVLTEEQILHELRQVLTIYDKQSFAKREDILRRVELVQTCVDKQQIAALQNIKCKQFYEFMRTIPMADFSSLKCHGPGFCNFELMNRSCVSDCHDPDQVSIRFREWMQSGLCHICQYHFFERESQNEWLQHFKPGSLNDFEWN